MSEVVDCIAFIIRKAFWSLWVFLKFVFLRILDFFGLIFNILACLTLLRFPVMVQQFIHMQSMWEWRFVGLVQLLIFISDIPFIVMAILMTLLTFGFVLIPFCKELKKEDVGLCDYFCPEYHNDDEDFNLIYDGFTLRKIIAEHFFKTICDILCLPMALICLCSWRCVIFVRQFKKSYTCWSHWTWRATAAVQFLQLMVDIPCIILGIILLPTWRFPFLVRRAKNKKWNTYRLFVFEEACLLIIDLFCFVAFLFAMVTWRGPFLVYKLYKAEPSQWKYRKFVFEQAGLVFVDIPCILCAAIIFVTLWRIRPFINNFSKNEWKVRRNCFVQLGMLLVDFACFVIGMVVVITLWRCYPLIRDVKKYCKPKKTSCEESESCKEVAESVNPEIEDGQDSHSVSEEGQGTIKVTISYTPEFRIQTWKIRKAIIKHFLFLFIDIPAIALCFLIFLTVIRFPKLLSKLLQSGAFYMEFALIAYSQAGKLIVDILFLCLFVVLMILRPIQSWIHLLEDEEHKKNRLLRFYSKFVPDIFSKRHQMYRELEEVFSNCLKIKMDYHTTRYHLSLISLKYLGELQWIRNKLKKHELDKEYDHMVHMIFWWEAKRAHKLSRLYRCELNYLAHPDVAIHNRNLLLYRNEMLQYESELQRHYRQLQEYVIPKVPLWTNQTGLMTRTRNETQRVLIRCLPSGRFLITMLILFNLLFIYRFPTLIRSLWGHWYNRRKIIFASTKQYLYDFLTILRIIVVLLLIYRAPFLITDIIRDLFYVRSWRAVRETAKRYPPWILDDLREMMKAVLSWKSVRFIITTMLFGLFMPAELFLTAIKLLGCNKCLSFLFTGILYIIFVGFPFVFSFYIGGKLLTVGLGSELTIIVGIFGAILILVLAGMATTLLRDHEGSSLKPVPYDYLRFNWSNMHVIIFEIVEYLQLLALVFAVADLPMVGAQVLNSASRYLLLNFASFQVKLWITFVLFIVWFFCVGAPVIFEQILESIPRGTCAKNIGWTLLVALLGNTLFVTMVESLISMLVCKYDKCEMGSSTVDSSTSMCATLYDEPNIKCWRGGHQAVAFFGLFGLVWYATTSIIFGTKYGDVTHPNQDFSFAPIYNTFVGFTKAVMVGIVVLAVSNTYLTVIALLILNLFALIFTVVFQKVFKYPVSNSFGLSIWRSVGFLSGVVASVAAIVAKVISNPQSSIPLIILCVCVPVVLFLAFVFSLLKKITTTTEEKRRQFRFTLLKLEKELVGRNQMVNSWSKQRKQWRRLVKNVFEAQPQENRIIQNVLNMHHFDVVTGERVTEDIEGEALDRESFAQQRDSTVDLPPPPSYDELFPNIRGEFDVLPEHTLPPGNLSIEIVHSDPKRPLEESLSARQLNNESSTTLSNKSQLPSPMSGTTESGTLATGESFIGACTKLEDTCTLPAEASLSESPTGQTRSDTGPTVEPLAGPYVEEEFTSALELGSQSEQSHSETGPSEERLAVPQPSEIIAAAGECYNAPQIVEQCGSRYNVEICEEFSRTRAFNSLTKLECSGSNLLLLLEHHIHYSAFSFTFVSQLSKWRRYVRHSNWIELLHGLQLLEASITDTFNSPSRADLIAGNESSEAVFKLCTDPDNEVPPTFAPEPQDAESLQAHSKAMRSRALQDISTIEKNSQEWVQLLDKILPPIPVIVNWVWNTDSTGTSFEILFRRSVQGSVANTGPKGIKMAKGASIVFPKRIRGCFTGSGKKLTFAKGFEPKGKKGPIIVTIKELGIKTKNSKLYITTQDKRLRFDKALDSIHVLTWK